MDRFPVLTVSPQSLAEILSEHPSLSVVPDKHAPGDYCVTLDSGTVIARGIMKGDMSYFDEHLKNWYADICAGARKTLDPMDNSAKLGEKRFDVIADLFVANYTKVEVDHMKRQAEQFNPGDKVQDAKTGEPLTVVKMLEHGGVLIEYPSGVRQQYYPEDLKKVSVQKLGTADKPATVDDLDRARRQAQTELMENDQVVIQTDGGALDGKTGVIRFVSQSPEGTKYTVALDEMVEFAGQMVPQVELPASQVRKAMKRKAQEDLQESDRVQVEFEGSSRGSGNIISIEAMDGGQTTYHVQLDGEDQARAYGRESLTKAASRREAAYPPDQQMRTEGGWFAGWTGEEATFRGPDNNSYNLKVQADGGFDFADPVIKKIPPGLVDAVIKRMKGWPSGAV